MPDVSYDIVRESKLWPVEMVLKKTVGRVAGVLAGHAKGHIAFVFSDNEMVHVLNREWRGMDKPTNVLSFPDGDADEKGIIQLGDVILAFETVTQEAKDQDIPFDDHLTHLLLHGSLHLMGHDHETEAEAEAMESLEISLLAQLNIKNPYQA